MTLLKDRLCVNFILCFVRFRPAVAKDVIRNTLHEHLDGKEYNSEEASVWTKTICDEIKDKLKGMAASNLIAA